MPKVNDCATIFDGANKFVGKLILLYWSHNDQNFLEKDGDGI